MVGRRKCTQNDSRFLNILFISLFLYVCAYVRYTPYSIYVEVTEQLADSPSTIHILGTKLMSSDSAAGHLEPLCHLVSPDMSFHRKLGFKLTRREYFKSTT